MRYSSVCIYKEEYLQCEVHLDVCEATLSRLWRNRVSQGLQFVGGQNTAGLESIYLLKSDQGLTRCGVELSVNRSGPISKVRKPLLSLTNFSTPESHRPRT